jgi:hypothetical protein
VACPWLIKRFVDPNAEFLYVPAEQVMEIAKREDAIPFDVANVELGHNGAECSFDAIMKKYNLTDPALQRLAIIVRGADTEAKDLAPECRGLEPIAEGFRLIFSDDHEELEHELPVYDALYAYCQKTDNETNRVLIMRCIVFRGFVGAACLSILVSLLAIIGQAGEIAERKWDFEAGSVDQPPAGFSFGTNRR